MSKRLSVLTNGLLKENPVLRLVLGTCPTLAVSTMASNGIGMGLAATYLPLIVVNCIILGRAEMFASKNGILDSALDGIGMGIGFTITLTIMGTIREILGSGTWMAGLDGLLPFLPEGFKIQVIPTSVDPFTLMTSAPGGFFVFGVMMAAATWLTTRPKKEKKPAETVEGGNA